MEDDDPDTADPTDAESNDILEEAQEDYQDKQQQAQELKNALVEEHGSPFVETEVDLDIGEPVAISGRAGGGLIELLGKVSKILNDPAVQNGDSNPDDDAIEKLGELSGGIDGVIEAMAELYDDPTYDEAFFRDLYRTDIVTFLAVAERTYTAIQKAQGRMSKSFR